MSALFLKFLEDFETVEKVKLHVPIDQLDSVRSEMMANRYSDIRTGPHPDQDGLAIVTAQRRKL